MDRVDYIMDKGYWEWEVPDETIQRIKDMCLEHGDKLVIYIPYDIEPHIHHFDLWTKICECGETLENYTSRLIPDIECTKHIYEIREERGKEWAACTKCGDVTDTMTAIMYENQF